MFQLTGYKVTEQLGQNEEIRLLRLVRQEDNEILIAKTSVSNYSEPANAAAFQYEYEQLSVLNGKGAAKPCSLKQEGDRPVLLLQDNAGWMPLGHLMESSRASLGLPALLDAAIAICRCLRQLHAARIILHELTPLSLLIKDDMTEAIVIDMRLCQAGTQYSPLHKQGRLLKSALPYISPELTGRTGLVPDYRSDLYSLGVILYEWFTGELPYQSDEAKDIVYQHLASMPEPVHAVNPSIPEVINQIINKCMEKVPSARYASVFGIIADLEECQAQLRVTGRVEPFRLGAHDVSETWELPEGLFGRQQEQLLLLQSLYRISRGDSEAVLVSGSAGIGKTAFIMETLREAAAPGGLFVACGNQSAELAKPYGIIGQALEQITTHLLALNQVQAEVWRTRMIEAAQDSGGLLTQLAPRLELLIGQLPSWDIGQFRLNSLYNVLDRFLSLFMNEDEPFIWFIDDLQWADEASIQYINHLLEGALAKHLLIVCAYREPAFAVDRLLEHLHAAEGQHIAVRRITLHAFDLATLQPMLSMFTHTSQEKARELAEVLMHKTMGNPLWTKQYIQKLLENRLIFFNEEERMWDWSLSAISATDGPVESATAARQLVRGLSDQNRDWLGHASFLGKIFNLNLLEQITGQPLQVLKEWAEHAVANHLLLPAYDGQEDSYAFLHEQIRQEAYSLINQEDSLLLHENIGWLLAARRADGNPIELADMLGHLNKARELIHDEDKRVKLIELNLEAGLQAKQARAFKQSAEYLRQAYSLIDDACWESQYNLSLQIHMEYIQAEYQLDIYMKADELFDQAEARARTDWDKAQVCLLRLKLGVNQVVYEEAVALGQRTFELLQMPFCPPRTSFQFLRQWQRYIGLFRSNPTEQWRKLTPMTDERCKAAMAAYAYVSYACYISDQEKWMSMMMSMLELTLEKGMTPEASVSFAGISIIHDYALNQYAKSFEWGQLARDIARVDARLYTQVCTLLLLANNTHARYQPTFMQDLMNHVDSADMENENPWHADLSITNFCAIQFRRSFPLNDLYTRMLIHSVYFTKKAHTLQVRQAGVLIELIGALTGHRSVNDPFFEVDVEAQAFRSLKNDNTDHYLLQGIYMSRYIVGYLFGDYEKALGALEQSCNMPLAKKNQYLDPSSQSYYEVLVLKSLMNKAEGKQWTDYWHRLQRSMKKIRKLAKRCPENDLHKYMLAKAEAARLMRRDRRAEHFYEQALKEARANGYLHDVAIISECYAEYGIQRDKPLIAKVYMYEAYYSYQKWGALKKAAQLEEKYGGLLQLKSVGPSMINNIDYISVVSSAQALSGEMEMDRLLRILMHTMLQNAGAEYGALISEDEGVQTVEAYGTTDRLQIESIPLHAAESIVPVAVIGYTARTREELVVHHAESSSMLSRNEYVRRKGVKSLLSLPIMHQNKLVCVLYLENCLTSSVFTEKKLDVLKLLSSQCAISLSNAKLYSGIQYLKDNLEQQVAERTRDLEKSMEAASEAHAEMTVYAERNRIAQEIHDIVGHTLTSTILQIEAGKRLLQKDMDSAVTRLKEAQDLVRHSLNEIRNSVHMLQEDRYYDIDDALERLFKDTERNTGVIIHRQTDPIGHLTLIQKKVLYHALQEGLTNGIRHGRCTEFSFHLQDGGSCIHFRLADNGEGAADIKMGFGLRMMKDRVQQLKGNLVIESEKNKGCLLRIELPC